MSKKPSKFPDKSEFAKGFSAGYRKGCADMDAKIAEIKMEGAMDLQLIMLFLLKDKYKSTDEDLMQLHADLQEYSQKVSDGFVTLEMIKTTLQNVHNIDFGLVE